ncbi:hypothetical protein HZA38_03185 [Candidatus Peregrinibacteria bacterium]|nr:hypothetical protein [Candidatus Peregrinibacteria bacterium]
MKSSFLRIIGGVILGILFLLPVPGTKAEWKGNLPNECTQSFSYEKMRMKEERTGQVILRVAENLASQVSAAGELLPHEGNTNFSSRSYAWLRSEITFEQPFQSFQELDHSECFRAELKRIDDALGYITSAIPKSKLLKKENMTEFTSVKNQFSTLKGERAALVFCAEFNAPGNVYYSKEYADENCEPKGKATFGTIVEQMKEIGERIKNLTSKKGLEDVFNTDQWKSNDDPKSKEAEDAALKEVAQSWYRNQFFPELNGVFSSKAEWKDFWKSPLEYIKNRSKKNKANEHNAENDKSEQDAEAITRKTLFGAMNALTQNFADLKARVEKQKEWADEILEILYDAGAAERWKEEIRMVREEDVKAQRERVQKLEKSLRRFVDNQARNIGN